MCLNFQPCFCTSAFGISSRQTPIPVLQQKLRLRCGNIAVAVSCEHRPIVPLVAVSELHHQARQTTQYFAPALRRCFPPQAAGDWTHFAASARR